MNWKIVFCLITFVSVAGLRGGDAGGSLFRQNFAPGEKVNYRTKGNVSFRNGVAAIERGSLDPDFSGDAPFLLTFEMRRRGTFPGRGFHCGVNIRGENDVNCMIFSRGKGVEQRAFRNGGQFAYSDGGKVVFSDDENAPFIPVRVLVGKNAISSNFAGENCTVNALDLLPVKNVSFYAYNCTMEVRNIEISPWHEKKAERIENPTFVIGETELERSKDRTFSVNAPLLSDKAGGIMFFFRSKYGKGAKLASFAGRDGKEKISVSVNDMGVNCRIARRDDPKKPLFFQRRMTLLPGEDHHFALTWDESGNARFFVDGLPYHTSTLPMQRCPMIFNADMDDIAQIAFPGASECVMDEVKVFHRPLANHEVLAEYRKRMPIDMVMEKSVCDSSRPDDVSVQLAPGGFYMRPDPTPKLAYVNADAEIRFELLDRFGDKALDETKKLHIDKRCDVVFPGVRLEPGKYRLKATVSFAPGKPYTRIFHVSAWGGRHVRNAAEGELKPGKKVLELDWTTLPEKRLLKDAAPRLASLDGRNYLEAGPQKGNRFAAVLQIPGKLLDKPALLEVDWPDDKERNMGFYLYPETMTAVNRDALQNGIQSGSEYPNSGTMQTTRYIIRPTRKSYLFEARTLAPGRPAAVSALRLYELPGTLPKLKLRPPKSLPGRRIGHMDEDQTFYNNFALLDNEGKKYPSRSIFITEKLLEYFDFTGQNFIFYPLWRYPGTTFFSVEGNHENGLFPCLSGEVPYLLDALAGADCKLIAAVNYTNLHEIWVSAKIEDDYRNPERGMEIRDKNGNPVESFSTGFGTANFIHPEVQKLFFRHLEEPLRLYARHPAMGGIALGFFKFGTWASLNNGYDDYTVKRFSQETGLQVPPTPPERYLLLTGKLKKEWLKWRAAKTTEFFRESRKLLDKYNPDLPLYYVVPSVSADELYEQSGVDLNELAEIGNIRFLSERFPTRRRHRQHWGTPEGDYDDKLYDPADPMLKLMLGTGKLSGMYGYYNYFETLNNSLSPRAYNCYFQNNDAKPHGRFFLKEPAFAVAAADADEILLGGQVLSAIGRESEMREFARAFTALPQAKFTLISGASDPVTGRYFQSKNGTYFYLVNTCFLPFEISLEGVPDFTDLSTGEKIAGGRLKLKPFELRSFLVSEKKVVPAKLQVVSGAKEAETFYSVRLETLRAALNTLKNNKIDCTREGRCLDRLASAIQKGAFAEAHRLAFSGVCGQLLKKAAAVKDFVARQKSIDAHIFRINCGSDSFFTAPDGRCFFPDQEFDGVYGHFGKYNSVARTADTLKNSALNELFRTEAYDIDGYKFQLPNGKYTVILHFKIGYRPGFRSGSFVFSVATDSGKIMDRADLYDKMQGDFDRVFTLTVPGVEVKDGVLTLRFLDDAQLPPGSVYGSWARLVNAIEIVKE